MKKIPDRLIKLTLGLAGIVVLTCAAAADEPITRNATAADDAGFTAAWQQLQAAVEVVMREHISPPSRQQLYLSACRGLYAASQVQPPGDLSERFSDLTTNEQFKSELAEVWEKQTARGIGPPQLARIAVAAALSSAVRPLSVVADDEMSNSTPQFVSEKENRVNKQLAENQYVGIGIKVGMKDGYPQILEPFYGGAAKNAGALEGDLIVAVNGVPCDGRAFGEIIDDLRGERGSSLEVTIRRNGDAEDRVYKMVREVIPISTVSGQQRNDDGTWVLELPGHADIAYVEITDIVGSTAAELIEMARKIEKQKFRAVILDFTRMSEHSVPDIHHAIMLADALLGEAQIGELYTRDNQTEIRTQPDHVLANTPLVIFTPRVASGPGFLVLAALANQGRAKLVGPRLTSRGLCTKSVELDGLGAINQLPYAVAVPRGKELSPTETASQFENHLSQLSECLTLIPDAIVEDASKMENYLKPALELLQQP